MQEVNHHLRLSVQVPHIVPPRAGLSQFQKTKKKQEFVFNRLENKKPNPITIKYLVVT